MKQVYTFVFTGLLGIFSAQAQNTSPYFAEYPTLTPDAKTVIFSYEGDLWKTDIAGQTAAVRLTAMQGNEINPRVSPDGKWLAFSSNQFGNNDIYVMSLAGGDVKQLTFNENNDELDSWSWDSKTIYFTSARYNNFSEYKVGVNGGTPTRLFDNYFNTIHGVVEHPQTGELFFNDTWESYRFANRKHYKGEYNPDIESYNPKTKAFKKYTDWIGKDFWATIDRKGEIFFVSDEGNEEYNLYTFIGGKKTTLTKFPTSVKRPQVSANGEKIVFEKDYQLFIYDVASRQAQPLSINIYRNNILPKQQEFDVQGKIEGFDISPDGRKMAYVSRGELFVSDVEGKFIQKLERNTAERVTEVKWLADNRTLIFNQTLDGYQNLYTIPANGTGTIKQLTSDKRNNRNIGLNKKRTMGVYLSGRDELRTIDLTTFASKTIVKDEFWGFGNDQPYFSPNGEYVLYTAVRGFEVDIFVYEVKAGKTINLTNTGVTENNPFWSPDGKYVYLSTSRTKPSYPFGTTDAHIYRMPLQKFDEAFRMDKFNDLFKEEKKEEPKPADDKTKKTDKVVKDVKPKPVSEQPEPKAPADIVIDTDKLMRRLQIVSSGFGQQVSPYVIQKGEKTLVYYISNQTAGKNALYRTTFENFLDPKTEKVDGGETNGFDIVSVGDKFFIGFNGTIFKLNIDANKLEKIDINYTFNRNLSAEFAQIFDETWANIDENYYDGKFHGVNWQAIHDRYKAYVPYINNRADLRLMLNDMLGELNSSHMGFTSTGLEERGNLRYKTMETGVVFSNTEPYKVEKVLKYSAADHKGIDIQTGDKLKSVNGVAVDEQTDRDYYFTKPSLDKELSLVFDRGGKSIAVKIHPEATADLKAQLYDEWIEHNGKMVEQESKNRIGYVYMKDMSGEALEKFLTDMVDEAYKKDALILDLRYNTGGNVHDEVLKFLSQKPYLQWQYRGGEKTPQPNFAPAAKPIVLLMNEQTLSDGEMTATGFKALGLGKIIGTETYRWIIFTSAKGLVDGSTYRLPSWGCFTLDGKDIEHEGVKPDIYIKTGFIDRLSDKDPQIDRAVSEIMKQLK
ncbi:MAG: S41 family peptidase [Mucilaginibacter sp.]|uniref:S41 family peptidase n=1 Tax=Mucilaginibacter sp. TaxID=1882438 RepID=UPI0032662BCF